MYRITSNEFVTLYVTCANQAEAESLATALLQERLVACVNILQGVTSLYHWEGAIQKETEVLLLAKTTQHKAQPATLFLTQRHSYTTPCITVLPLSGGNADYLAWIKKEVGEL
jgi:periplasmic divalent cation tolerance protein